MAAKPWKYLLGGGALVVAAGVIGSYAIGTNPLQVGAAFMNIFRSAGSPGSEFTVELRQAAEKAAPPDESRMAKADGVSDPGDNWPAYNRTVYGDRFSPLTEINADNVSKLKEICSFDTEKLEGNQGTPLVVDGIMYITTAEDIYAIDPATCKENWRTHEPSGLGIMPVNRGAAFTNGKVVRGFPDGYVRAYDGKTGKKVWETFIGDRNNKNLWFTSAATAWNGMVFYGVAGGDLHNNRGRVFGLNAETGEILWQTFTVPKLPEDAILGKEGHMPYEQMMKTWQNPPEVPITGGGVWTNISVDPTTGQLYVPVGNPAPDFVKALRLGSNEFANTMLILDAKTGDYVTSYAIMEHDYHDWDMSNAPIFYRTRGGKDVFTFHPKDGHLYTYDLAAKKQLYRMPVTKILNENVELNTENEVYFCPGSVGGGEWSSAAYDPEYNLIFTGQNEWCTTVRLAKPETVSKAPDGMIWFGAAYINPYYLVGKSDPPEKWGGWIYATDADTGEWKWRVRANYPTISGVLPTAGGIVAFGDMGGSFRILRASDGATVLDKKFDGGIAGGVITYKVQGKQYIALTVGMHHPQWPVKPTSARVVIMSLGS